MTAARSAETCRLTVVGPDGRADVAVPISSTIAGLLPVLVRHTLRGQDSHEGSWVLQRLGEPPLDPDGTPETLDLLEGEQLYLRPAENPMPELDFDDIADGMATAVNRRPDRWQPEYSRWLFLSLSGITVLAMLLVLQVSLSGLASTISAGVLAGVFLGAAVAAGRKLDDLALTTAPGLAGCAFAAYAGLVGVGGMDGVLALEPMAVVIGALATTVAAGVLLTAKVFVSPRIPLVPFGVIAAVGVETMVGVWLGTGAGFTVPQAAGILSTGLFALMILSAKLAIRAARLRGPQLPRTAEELQVDLEPHPAEQVIERTGWADRYLSVLTVSSSAVFAVCFPYLLTAGGWLGPTLTGVFAAALLLRSRQFFGAWQRLAVTAAGVVGMVLVVVGVVSQMPQAWHGVTLVLLLGLVVSLVLAATRPPNRRLLPLWGHLADMSETLTAVAVLPILLQLLGFYAWARGLAG
ncbi:type VII secretion integral membrane protein EccD [Actinokineospora bangkokensis]|uniref:Type VII secretion integral membrane protein EccD n=1 Tax=Actinokineospora bangkokensis TaxID=1193682 RepID=A0A1Q9LJG7_9PSEU|nr:type VII secretion integral membrane protein EccD [Actinokineospora bangkokensis]OLR92192.1 type VII secretion integral membrane protein EccD [Actinokineospora bangkokensis]